MIVVKMRVFRFEELVEGYDMLAESVYDLFYIGEYINGHLLRWLYVNKSYEVKFHVEEYK